MFSIFHFFADLMAKRALFAGNGNLESFPFNPEMLSCRREGRFPDMAIRLNPNLLNDPLRSGGELIELKDAQSYSVASFNSTIPTGAKQIAALVDHGKLGTKMAERGDDVHSLPERQVYYLLRGRKKNVGTKMCLVHGSFFETVDSSRLIGEAFRQALESAGVSLASDAISVMSKQETFSTSREVDKASVTLRFRVMVEAHREANILKNYPEIPDDTLNLVVPLHGKSEDERDKAERRIKVVADEAGIRGGDLRMFRIKHPFNGYFLVMQVPLNAE